MSSSKFLTRFPATPDSELAGSPDLADSNALGQALQDAAFGAPAPSGGIVEATGTAAGAATVVGNAASIAGTQGTSVGAGSAGAAGAGIGGGTGSSGGSGGAGGAAALVEGGSGTAAGVATVEGEGQSVPAPVIVEAVGTASGSSTVIGYTADPQAPAKPWGGYGGFPIDFQLPEETKKPPGIVVEATGTATGGATVTGHAAAIKSATGEAAGNSEVTGFADSYMDPRRLEDDELLMILLAA